MHTWRFPISKRDQICPQSDQSAASVVCSRKRQHSYNTMTIHKLPRDPKVCECTDPGCSHCLGYCQDIGETRVFRIDMEDYSGTLMCAKCTDDAMESGVFSLEESEEPNAS